MEKRKPAYDLESIKAAVASGRYRITFTARHCAHALGMGDADICQTVLDISQADFYKSMTTYADVHVWQDVYRPQRGAARLYVKFQIDDNGYLIVSFKEK